MVEAGTVTEMDGTILAVYAQAFSDIETLTKEIREEGTVVQSARGGPRRNPKTTLLREAYDRLHKAIVELGLTPSSRSRVKAVSPKLRGPSRWKKLEPDPWDDV